MPFFVGERFPIVRISVFLGFFVWIAVFEALSQAPGGYAQAERDVREQRWDEGITILQSILQADPDNLKALNLFGIALTGKGERKNADLEFEQALRVDSQFLPSLKNLAINEFTLKDTTAAERHLQMALKLAPADPVVRAYLGEIAYSRHHYKDAAHDLAAAGQLISRDQNIAAHLAISYLEINDVAEGRKIIDQIDVDGLNPPAELELASALARHNLFAPAIVYFEKLEQSFPDSYDLGFNLAICYVETKQFPQAIAVLRKLADYGHTSAELDNLLAEAYEGNQQTKEAIDALREATTLAPKDEDNYLDLSTLCIDHDAYDIAMEVVEVGLHHRPKSARLMFQRGMIHALQDQFELAEKDFQAASALAPDKNLSAVGMSYSYIQTGNLPEAIRLLRRRTREKPNDYVLQYLLGDALLRSGVNPEDTSFQDAQGALEKSISLNDRFAPAQVALAKVLLKENRVDDAIGHLEKARSLDPEEKSAYSQLAIAYRRQGKPELAKQMLASLTQLNEQDRSSSRDHARLIREGASDQSGDSSR